MNKARKEIVINVSSTETRVAILENGTLVELYFERAENERMVGDIYKGKIENVVEAVQAAFVEIGLDQNGFLSFSDAEGRALEFSSLAERVDDLDADKQPRRRFRDRGQRRRQYLKSGEDILVQVTKEPIGNKGTRLTTAVSLPGRFLVLVPNDATVGVSRKIEDFNERKRLRRLAKSFQPQGFGMIIRTVAMGKDAATLKTDLDQLLKTWRKIEEKAKSEKAPRLLHKEMGMTSSVIRDLFSPDISRLVVDSRKLYGEIRKYLSEVSPNLLPRLEMYRDHVPVFDSFKIEEQIERGLSRKIWFKKGGYIVFDQTEAMAVIDVNSGRSVSQRDHELHALETDLEAVREISKQLRLRDMGGIIVIDFIDLRSDKNRKKVASELKRELEKDRAAFDILPMSDFGIVQLTRERVRPNLIYRYSEACPRCDGMGRVPSKSTLITKIERRIKQIKSTGGEKRLVLRVHPDLAEYLSEGFKSRIRQLMLKYFVLIKIVPDEKMKEEDISLDTAAEEKKGKNTFSA
jgi:ribonuclease G